MLLTYYPTPIDSGLGDGADIRMDNRLQEYAGSFFGSAALNKTFPNDGGGTAAESDLLLVAVQSPVAGTWAGTDYTVINNNVPLDSSFATLAYRVDPGNENTSPWSYNFGSSINNWHYAEREAQRFSAAGLVSGVLQAVSQVGGTTFPTVTTPGTNWLVIYHVQFAMSVGASPSEPGGNSIAGSSYTMDPRITEFPLNGQYPEIHRHGESSWGRELAPAGTVSGRTFTGVNMPSYTLTSIVCDTRF